MWHHSFSLILSLFVLSSPITYMFDHLTLIYRWHVQFSFFFKKIFFPSCISVDKFYWHVFKLIIFSAYFSLLISPPWYLYFCSHNFSTFIGLILIVSIFLLKFPTCSQILHAFSTMSVNKILTLKNPCLIILTYAKSLSLVLLNIFVCWQCVKSSCLFHVLQVFEN